MLDVKHIIFINDASISQRITSTWSRSGIQSAQTRFKFIQFNNRSEGQVGRVVGEKNTIVYIEDVPVDVDNNCYPFINIVDYVWAKFLQMSKILKHSMGMFFYDPNLAPMRE